VHQLLSLARNEVEVKLQPLDLAELARDVARQWTPRALKAGIDLGFEGVDHLLVQGEPLLLREALANLIDNALTYAGSGSEVTLNVQSQGGQALLEVSDNGVGLSEADLPHVFERFWRASSLPGGCGLGLAIVREIAQRHGGNTTVSANVPHGLCVQLRLPLTSV
jgi:two-component system sensor histidine kinase TctE